MTYIKSPAPAKIHAMSRDLELPICCIFAVVYCFIISLNWPTNDSVGYLESHYLQFNFHLERDKIITLWQPSA